MTKDPSVLNKYGSIVIVCLLLTLVTSNSSLRSRVLTDDSNEPRKVNSPSSYDWRTATTMTPVKNQADCNAYYAFSTIAFFEQDLILNQGAPSNIDLSEQFLTTCLPSGGCVGGNPKDAMEFAIKKGGIPTESAYPFSPYALQPQDICYPSKQISVGTRPMVSYFNIEDQQFLKSLLLKQPLNIYICSEDLKSYAPKSDSERKLSCNKDNYYADHTVLLVGYTQTEWIIKNSWSSNWGLGGYAYISRNAENDCCIGNQVFMRGKKTDTANCTVQNCQVCVQNIYCSKCKPGYFVSYQNGSHKCVECNYENCAQCQNNVGYCKTCIFGYALYFPEQVCKKSIIPNCKSIVNGGCKTCHDGFRVTANFTCQNDCKIADCQMCKDDKSCSKCKAGFVLTYANNTLSCQQNKCKIQNCVSCDSTGKCLSCVGSYTIEEDSCVMKCNKQNCQQCSETKDICGKCNDGNALDFYSHECVTTNVANCNQTYLTKYCSICQDGYLRSDSWQQCSKICAIDNCKICEAGFANKCNQCKDGYTLKVPQNQTIAICQINPCNISNCTLCNPSGDTCVQCMDKYHEWNWSTKSCTVYTCPLENCKKCMIGAKKCEQCMDGMIPYITTGGCIKSTIDNCQAMGMGNNGTQCWDCQSGYSIDYSTWKACKRICVDSHCTDCSDDSRMCKTCLAGYATKNVTDQQNKCVKIPTYMPNCLRGNSDQTVCYECKQFYYYDNTTSSCQLNDNCPKDCLKCSGKDEVLKCECKSGFVWDFINLQCVINPSDSQCLVISNYTGAPQCFECKDGFTLTQDGKGCESACAVDNCNTCVMSQVENYPDYCQICNEGYVVNLNLTKCLKCQVDYCKTCAGPTQLTKCTECKLGYELKDGACTQVPCPKNSVFNGLQCACNSQYYKDTQTDVCKSCSTSCKRCYSSELCLECLPGYYLDSSFKCSACFANCQSCISQTTCDACQEGYTYQIKNGSTSCQKVGLGHEGYFILSSGKKARCMPGCASCAKTQFTCQQCLKGYILKDQQCLKCSDNCQTCFPNVLSACKSCQIGFSLVEGQCIRCKSSACIDCPVQTDICTACMQGYYVKDQTCKSCGIGCKTCSSDGKCASCHTGFAMLESGYCEQCLDGCSQCSGDALHECKGGCLQGTYRENEKCLTCPQICITCESKNKCTGCVPGYELVDGVCRKWCTDWNCFDCSSDSDVCKECYAGYTAVNGKCEDDIECNVETHQSNSTTNNTTTNTTDNTTANNTTNNTNNTTTDNTTTNNTTTNNSTTNDTTVNTSGDGALGNCEICPKKYYLSNNSTCQKCTTSDTNCIACSKDSPANCTQCAQGYFVTQQGTCIKCTDNCYTCRSSEFCYICSAGYFMVQENIQYSGNCAKCDSNCLTCIGTPKNCLTCKQGYVLSVANLCMNQDMITYKIKLDMPFRLYSEKFTDIKYDIISMFGNSQNPYLLQVQKAISGSTQFSGYVSIPQDEKNKGDTFTNLTNGIKGGSYIDGFQILSASLVYNGNTYNSDKPADGGSGVQGWIIAVAVVGGVIGLILTIILISCIVKKVKAKKDDEDSDQHASDSGKATSENLKKQNPELN